MRPDLATYRSLVPDRKPKVAPAAEVDRRLRQAQLAADYVTSSPEWNGFLAIIEQHNEDDESAINDLRKSLESDGFIDSVKLMEMRQQMAILRARVETRSEILALPRSLSELSQKTK